MTISELKGYLEENLDIIREEIRTRKYKPSPVRRIEIPKDNGGTRNLGIPTVIDRVYTTGNSAGSYANLRTCIQ